MSKHHTHTLLTFAFALTCIACTDTPALSRPIDLCEAHLKSCGPGEFCINDECRILCSSDKPCPFDDICVGGLCEDGYCGDGIQAGAELCDLGDANSNNGHCLLDCSLNVCGDGHQLLSSETCDDGNLRDGDGCSSLCQLEDNASSESESELDADDPAPRPGESPRPQSVDNESECEGFLDCEQRCHPSYHQSLIGDGFCDELGDPISLNCSAFEDDGGDCANLIVGDHQESTSNSEADQSHIELSWNIVLDLYSHETSWEVYTYDQIFTLFLGSSATAEPSSSILLKKGSYCFSVYDSFGDGGTAGELRANEYLLGQWSPSTYTYDYSVCFEVSFATCSDGYIEDCSGHCIPDAALQSLGDNQCNNAFNDGPDLDCAAYQWDFTDCL